MNGVFGTGYGHTPVIEAPMYHNITNASSGSFGPFITVRNDGKRNESTAYKIKLLPCRALCRVSYHDDYVGGGFCAITIGK